MPKTSYQDKLVTDTLNDIFASAKMHDITLSQSQKASLENALKSKVLSGDKTAAKVAKSVKIDNPEAIMHLFNLLSADISDEISDEEAAKIAGADTYGYAEPTKVTPENLPAIINKGLTAAGEVEVEWSMVKHLPGYLKNPIRALGRQIFKQFTNTPIEKIQVIANIGGGPNEMREINAVAHYARKYGSEINSSFLDFDKIMPGYTADVKVYDANGLTYMLVKDMAGSYIYSWPSNQAISKKPKMQAIEEDYKYRSFKEFLELKKFLGL